MINLVRFQEFIAEMKAVVNTRLVEELPGLKKKIDHVHISPTESHLIKKIANKSGVILAVKLAEADSEIESIDSYSEMNHELWFVLEKVDPGIMTDAKELTHYAELQQIMRVVKEYVMEQGLTGNVFGGDETLAKPFHTEWEYQAFGGFNGLSTSFDLQDFEL